MKFLTFNNKYLPIVFHFVVIFDVQVFRTAAFRSPGVLLRGFRCLGHPQNLRFWCPRHPYRSLILE